MSWEELPGNKSPSKFQFSPCNGLNACAPQNSDSEILIPNMMVFGGGAFEGYLGHEDEALRMGFPPS